jgi:periplasmic copper chaperone A
MRAITVFLRGVVLGAGLLIAGAACAADIEIAAPWARATAKGARVGAGYLTIVNKGKSPDRLTSAASDVAESVEVHAVAMENSVMTMRAAPEGVEIKSGETVVFKPGGLHLMLMGLKQPLTQGGEVRITLNFAKAGPIAVNLPIGALGATGPETGDAPPQISY